MRKGEQGEAKQQRHEHHYRECGEQASGPPLVEIGKRKRTCTRELAGDELRDQIAGDDEENVDAAVAAGSERQADMVRDDAEYGDGAEAVDVGAVAGGSFDPPNLLRNPRLHRLRLGQLPSGSRPRVCSRVLMGELRHHAVKETAQQRIVAGVRDRVLDEHFDLRNQRL